MVGGNEEDGTEAKAGTLAPSVGVELQGVRAEAKAGTFAPPFIVGKSVAGDPLSLMGDSTMGDSTMGGPIVGSHGIPLSVFPSIDEDRLKVLMNDLHDLVPFIEQVYQGQNSLGDNASAGLGVNALTKYDVKNVGLSVSLIDSELSTPSQNRLLAIVQHLLSVRKVAIGVASVVLPALYNLVPHPHELIVSITENALYDKLWPIVDAIEKLVAPFFS